MSYVWMAVIGLIIGALARFFYPGAVPMAQLAGEWSVDDVLAESYLVQRRSDRLDAFEDQDRDPARRTADVGRRFDRGSLGVSHLPPVAGADSRGVREFGVHLKAA